MRGRDVLRAINAVLSAVMLALFLVHGIGNAFQMMGVGTPLSKAISHTLLACVAVHAVIGVVLTVDTLRAQRAAGASYPRQNLRFWAVRLSGLAVALFIAAHVLIFLRPEGAAIRLAPFLEPQLVLSMLLVVSLAVHVLSNMEPLMVSLGIPLPHARAVDFIFALAVLLALMAVAFVVYYLRWSVV